MHIPLNQLPPEIQEKVMGYLQADNFQAAKRVRDQYEENLRALSQKRVKSVPMGSGLSAHKKAVVSL